MTTPRFLLLLVALCVALAACGGDDGDASDDAGAADGSATTSDDQMEDDDAGDDEDADGGDSGAAEGTGVVTIDGDDYDFTVEFCEGGEGSLVRIAGPGTAPDGQPFWVEVRWGLGGPVATQLGVGVTDPSAGSEGDPHFYNSLDDGEQYVSFDDEVSIAYDDPFAQADDPSGAEVPGTVDASCVLN